MKKYIVDKLLESGCIKYGNFVLKSGEISNIYFDLRRLVSFPKVLNDISFQYLSILQNLKFDRIAGLPYAGLPIATAVSINGNYPMIYPRSETKSYGTKAEIEGVYFPNETIVLIDDVVTTGGAKLEAIEKLERAKLKISDIVVLIDREQGAFEMLQEKNIKLHSLISFSEISKELDNRKV